MTKIYLDINESLLALTGDVSKEYEKSVREHLQAGDRRLKATAETERQGRKLVQLCRRRFSQILASHYSTLEFSTSGFAVNHDREPWRMDPFIKVSVMLRGGQWTITRTFWPRSAEAVDQVARQIKKVAEELSGGS